MTVIDMKKMRYINLLFRVADVKTTKCFIYNNIIIFAVPSHLVSKAIGPNGNNIRIMQERLGKRIKIIRDAAGISGVEKFIGDIVEPFNFVSLEIKDNEIIITAGMRSKAALLGRNKRRLEELKEIVHDNFGKELKII